MVYKKKKCCFETVSCKIVRIIVKAFCIGTGLYDKRVEVFQKKRSATYIYLIFDRIALKRNRSSVFPWVFAFAQGLKLAKCQNKFSRTKL